jgi:hypothetical protein
MKSMRLCMIAFVFLATVQVQTGYGQLTERQYLSGTGKDSTVAWEFFLSSGRGSGSWTTIPVPSNWELKGFGAYGYQTDPTPVEQGRYRYTFTVPSAWSQKRVEIVFDGAQTDAQVLINSQSAGPLHQGGFYRFKYDITGLLRFGQSNTLEVNVNRSSANASVNTAERRGDYWNFSGIFRPVFLEAFPVEHIDRLAINAQSSGSTTIDVYLKNITTATSCEAQIRTLGGTAVGSLFSAALSAGLTKVRLTSTVSNPTLWSVETPNLYRIDVSIKTASATIHSTTERFGFRTIEVRSGNGIYINNQKMRFRGVNRHCFWPSEGRTLNRTISRDDILLIKQANMNIVRMSHYPPDVHFLDLCDSLGLYVLDELAGWQGYYDDTTGKRLIGDMIARDVNHPCIIFWDNGNEGGWNVNNDTVFGNRDIQNRAVLHPDGTFSNVNTKHYNVYSAVQTALNGTTIFMPTEIIHGLYDGGAGASLYDYWSLMCSRPISAGCFIWALVDEGVVRTDQGGVIDRNDNRAPDGIVGPYREKEGSFYAIKEIWSPIYIDMDTLPASFTGSIPVDNRYDFTNLSACTFTWKLVNFSYTATDTGRMVGQSGTAPSPSVAPHAQGTLTLNLPQDWKNYQGLLVSAYGPDGREVYTWSWMVKNAIEIRKTIVDTAGTGSANATENAASITVTAGAMEYVFSKTSGTITSVKKSGRTISLTNGPQLAHATAQFSGISFTRNGNAVVITVQYTSGMQSAVWTIYGSGWLKLSYSYSANGSYNYLGINFDYPESRVAAMQWLGKGPYRVWKNRLKGTTFNVWRTAYNNTSTGEQWVYPEFKGYFDEMRWVKLITNEDTLNFVCDNNHIFFRNFTPPNPSNPVNAVSSFPSGNLSFLHGIAPIGDKFNSARDCGPQGQPNAANGTYAASVYMYFGKVAPVTGVAHEKTASPAIGTCIKILTGREMLQIKLPFDGECSVDLRGLNGQIVARVNASGHGTAFLPIRRLSTGMYMLSITNRRQGYTEKIFLQ